MPEAQDGMVNTCSETPVLLEKARVGRLSNSDSLAMFVAMRLVQKQQDRLAAHTAARQLDLR